MATALEPCSVHPGPPFHCAEVCRVWGRTQLPRTRTSFQIKASDKAAPFSIVSAAAFDVLRVSVGSIAVLNAHDALSECDIAIDVYATDWSADHRSHEIAYHFSILLRSFLRFGEAALDRPTDRRTRRLLCNVIDLALLRFIAVDPDLYRVALYDLCWDFHQAFRYSRPDRAIAVVNELQALLYRIDTSTHLPQAPDASEWPTFALARFRRSQITEALCLDYEDKIVSLEARQDQLCGDSIWISSRREWLNARLAEL